MLAAVSPTPLTAPIAIEVLGSFVAKSAISRRLLLRFESLLGSLAKSAGFAARRLIGFGRMETG
jgi:hypothetical protein